MANSMAIVMAAGKGTRMKSELPKVLVPVCGRPMIDYLLDTLAAAGIERIVVVVGYRSDLVRAHLNGRPRVEFAEQSQQLGTGHAVMMCREQLAGHDGPVLILAGDSPLAQRSSLEKLLQEYHRRQAACLLGTTHKSEPRGLGRIVRDVQGHFEAIVEEKDATDAERQITEVNMSCYVFRGPDLLFALDQIRAENAQGEYYLTDCPGALKKAGRLVEALPVLTPIEALSINTVEELAIVERAMQNQNA
jgi:bifunctional UDP-N-acetylglucosamine pyrophosphorylase/glucosamine-1-phosphate N-acetyltransferase/UDP-N-acetylglucosamine pyrophosphorylase